MPRLRTQHNNPGQGSSPGRSLRMFSQPMIKPTPGAHYPELPSSILTLWFNPVSYLFIFRSTSHGGFRECFCNSQSWESCCGLHVTYNHRGHESISMMAESDESLLFFKEVMRTSACFRGKLQNSRRYHSSKNKKIRDRVDSRVQFIWRLRVMGSWIYIFLQTWCDNVISHVAMSKSAFYLCVRTRPR